LFEFLIRRKKKY